MPSRNIFYSHFLNGTESVDSPEFKRLAAVQGDFIFQGPRRNLLSKASASQDAWGFRM